MLTNDQQYILHCLRNSLNTNTSVDLISTDDYEVADAIIRNGILLTAFQNLSGTQKELLKSQYFAEIKHTVAVLLVETVPAASWWHKEVA